MSEEAYTIWTIEWPLLAWLQVSLLQFYFGTSGWVIPSMQKLRSVIPIESSISSLGCESCELDKHHCTTFQSWVNNRNSSAFELVHSNVWGPSHVPSIKGFRYFLLFVDDFSHIMWLYLLKEKSKVSSVIELFFNEIKNQFFTSIRVLRTDNALDVKKDVSIFCSKNEIIHQTSCSHTSQQNGVVECKNRHILDVARTIMIHTSVSKHLWSNDVLSACHLINIMPSSVLDKESLFSCLFPSKTLFSMTPCFRLHLFCSGLFSWTRQVIS